MSYSYAIELYPQSPQSLSRKQRSLLNLAVRQAESSDVTNRHGAVVVKGGRVHAVGQNRWRNQAYTELVQKMPTTDITVHAEIDALSRVADPRGATVYIARISTNGAEMLSRPCDTCAEALMAAGVKQVIYTVGSRPF